MFLYLYFLIVSIFQIHSFSGSSESNSGAEVTENVEPGSSGALEIAGHTLGGAEADLVLNPLRLAFETKNTKMVELALDCLHVGAAFCS